MRLSRILAIPPGVTAVVGGGGKTTLIRCLAEELCEDARVLMLTTTHMWPPPCATLLSPNRAEIQAAFGHTRLLAAGDPGAEGKLTAVLALGEKLEGLADYVLVEADGSRGLPLKAPAAHEPVLPEQARLTIAVAGMACAGLTVAQAAHRPQHYAQVAQCAWDAAVTPQMVARVLASPQGQRKGVGGRFAVVLNQADTPVRVAFARAVAKALQDETLITALQGTPAFSESWCGGIRRSGLPSGA